MGALLTLISFLCGIAALVCFILVLVKMFQNNQTTMGIVCIVTVLLCGIGILIAFILGWVNAAKWRIQQIMMVWTACILVQLVITIINIASGTATFRIEGM